MSCIFFLILPGSHFQLGPLCLFYMLFRKFCCSAFCNCLVQCELPFMKNVALLCWVSYSHNSEDCIEIFCLYVMLQEKRQQNHEHQQNTWQQKHEHHCATCGMDSWSIWSYCKHAHCRGAMKSQSAQVLNAVRINNMYVHTISAGGYCLQNKKSDYSK